METKILSQVYFVFRLRYFPATARKVTHCQLAQPMCVLCDRSLMHHILPEKQAHSWLGLGFRWRDFPNNSLLVLYVNFLKTICGCLAIIRIKVRHLKSCVTGRLCLGCLRTTVTEYSSAITRTFAINSVIVVPISHILSEIYRNSKYSSGYTSGCNGGMFLTIHNFHWNHTIHKRCKYSGNL